MKLYWKKGKNTQINGESSLKRLRNETEDGCYTPYFRNAYSW